MLGVKRNSEHVSVTKGKKSQQRGKKPVRGGGVQNGVGKDKEQKKQGAERGGERGNKKQIMSQKGEVPEAERTTPTTSRCQKVQRLGKSGPYPLGTRRGHRRSERDRMSTGPKDALRALRLEEIKLEKIKLKPAI